MLNLKRSKLLMIAAAQVACLAIGVLWFSGWLQRSVLDAKRVQILQSNEALVRFLADRIDATVNTHVSHQPNWSAAQNLVDSLRLPNEGFAYVIHSETREPVCEPSAGNSLLLTESHDSAELRGAGGAMTFESVLKDESRTSVFSGYVDLADGIHLVAAKKLQNADAMAVVHQREHAVTIAVREILGPVRSFGLGFALLITVLGLIADSLILQKYDGKLAEANERLEQLINIRTKSLVKTRNAIIFGLAKLAESRDTDTGEHLERIRRYVTVLAQRLAKSDRSIDRDFISNLALASSLHDIGKVGIPDSVLLKPGRLDAEEREIIERHPQIGGKCLEAIQAQLGSDDFLEMARMIADSHHERWDGTGYPQQLKGEDIPLVARIVALADVYDALTTKRPYKDAMSHAKAMEIIVEGRGTHFDPTIVEAFLHRHKEFATIACEHADDKLGTNGATVVLPDVDALLSQPARA